MPDLKLSPQLEPYRGLIVEASQRHGVDPALLAGVLMYESGGNPSAGHPTSGATGLGQVMPRESGFPGRPTRAELLDPATNIEWSARILADGVHRYGPAGGLAAYLGAVDPKTGQPTNAKDANGTTGVAYVQNVMNYAQQFGYSGPTGGPPVADSDSLTKLRTRESDLENRKVALEATAKSGSEYERGQATTALTEIDKQIGSVQNAILAEENRQRDDARAANAPPAAANSTSEFVWQRGADGTPQLVPNPAYRAPKEPYTPKNAAGQRTEDLQLQQATLALQRAQRDFDEADSPEAKAQKQLALDTARYQLEAAKAQLTKATMPGTVTVDGVVYPLDPATGLPIKDRGVALPQAPAVQVVNGRAVRIDTRTGERAGADVELLTPAERQLADLHAQASSAADQYTAQRAAMVKDLQAKVASREITAAEASRQLDTFDGLWSTQARQLQQQEGRLRAQTMSEQTGRVYDPATGQTTGELTAAERERQRAAGVQERQTAETARANQAREAETARGNDLQTGASLYNQAVQASQNAGDAAMRTAVSMLPNVAPKGTAEDLAGLRNALAGGTAPPQQQARTMPVPNFLNIGRQVASQVLAELSPTARAYLDAGHPGQRLPGVSAISIPPFGQAPGTAAATMGAPPVPPGAGIPPFRAPAPGLPVGALAVPSERGF